MNTPKRFKHESTLLEYLPNELFVEIFGYLKGVDTIYAFSQLNIRFQYLSKQYVKSFDFQLISKAKFHFITQLHNIYQCRSLYLSNDDHTPGQIQLFCQLFPFNEYIHQLEFLTALNMTQTYAQEFLLQIRSFKNLRSLSIGTVCGFDIPSFELPSLKRLILTSCKHTNWLMNFPDLKSLDFTIKYNCTHNHQLVFPKTLTQLKIFYEEIPDGNAIRTLLHQMSQLTKLSLYNNGNYSPLPNGQIWEELIVSCLPYLNTFQFYFPFENHHNNLDDLNQIIESYSTPFYLIEKRWFIRCDRNSDHYMMGAIYSLPFAFSQMPINTHSFDLSISTLPIPDLNEIKSNYYMKVKTLIFNQECKQPHLGFVSTNIHHLILTVNLPRIWNYFLNELRHLTIGNHIEMSIIDFENILQHSPKLSSLTISSNKLKKLTEKFSNKIICQYLSEHILTLTISHEYLELPNLGYVSVRLLTSIVRIFSNKCEHLSLALIAHPNTVRPILRRMKQLRSLHMEWRHLSIGNDDSVACWLEQQSTEPTALDFVHTMNKRHLFIWFGNRF